MSPETVISYRFLGAPSTSSGPSQTRHLRALVFDMDGTLNLPVYTMFPRMRLALGITPTTDILAHLNSFPPGAPAHLHASAIIASIEREAIDTMALQPGTLALLDFLDAHDIPKAILTRNNREPVDHLLAHLLPSYTFDPVITRDFLPPKPSPAPLLYIAQAWGLHPAEVAMVGDGKDDMQCGREAGAVTIMVENEGEEGKVRECERLGLVDLTVKRVDEIVEVLRNGFAVMRREEAVVEERNVNY